MVDISHIIKISSYSQSFPKRFLLEARMKAEKKMRCPPKCTLCYWMAAHTADEGFAHRQKENLIRNERVYESVLCNERLAIILTYNQQETQFASLRALAQNERDSCDRDVQKLAVIASATHRSFDEQITQVQKKMEGASDSYIELYGYRLRRELMYLKKQQKDEDESYERLFSSMAENDHRNIIDMEEDAEDRIREIKDDYRCAIEQLDDLLEPVREQIQILEWSVQEKILSVMMR
ncbi:uncharacterized protein LY89DRAFT_748912 [Mollisia scopiformis]|uniref:Uncharacterized protein n=1 Tax=Mollisia scopiformis TaxID=149040 RepID=A0A194X892_MOLSC|nr:uncharacterized protein LY89DRAFT_748912 [Mollisia scopiformis]KUJ16334.1 hypothetical protein LY89DRAFT_748912 [Mollisia scopiformis]